MLVLPARSRLHPLRSASCLCQSPPRHSTGLRQSHRTVHNLSGSSAAACNYVAYDCISYLGKSDKKLGKVKSKSG